MSIDIFVKTSRGGAPLLARVALQLDTMSVQEASYYGGAAPYFRYAGYIDAIVDVQQQDLLTDLNTLEPKTNPPNTRNKQYRVISDPEVFSQDGHMELVVDRMVGNTP